MGLVKQEIDNLVMDGKVKRIIAKKDTGWQSIVIKKHKTALPDFLKENEWYSPNEYTAVGYFKHEVDVGQIVSLTGKWVKDKKYGWQFIISDSDLLKPKEINEIEEYLSSGIYKGIGEKTAKLIVAKFGENSLDIVENHPEKLSEIKGVKKAKISSIKNSQTENGHLKEIKLFLGNHEGVTWNRINKIYNRYGEKAIEVLSENPYVLCDEIDGFAFKTADTIAQAAGIPFNSPFRIKSGVIYLLNYTANTEGNLYLSQRSLLTRLTKLLSTDKEKIDSTQTKPILKDMVESKQIIAEGENYFLKSFYEIEKQCAKMLYELSECPLDKSYDSENIDEKIAGIEKKLRIKYQGNQRLAVRQALLNNVSIITGGPGTGKTTIIKGIISLLKNENLGYTVLCAPTGRAAKKMEESTGFEAQTIHRLLIATPEFGFKMNEKNQLNCSTIIVDELSMVDIYIFNALLKAIKQGTRVIFVGDSDQLPSVGPGSVLKDLIKSQALPVVILSEIYRQASTSKIIVNAHKINNGNIALETGSDFEFINEEDSSSVATLIISKVKEESEKSGQINSVQVLSPLRTRTSVGVDILNERLQKYLNPVKLNKQEMRNKYHTFRENDRVMQTKNDYDRDVFNGTIGRISSIDKNCNNELIMTVETEDDFIEYTQEDLENLDLAYATTVHKAQGDEYPIVIIPVLPEFYPFLSKDILYTAVTRARKKVILIGTIKALAIAIKNNKNQIRNTMLAKRISQIFISD